MRDSADVKARISVHIDVGITKSGWDSAVLEGLMRGKGW